jgi:hypothetical protein
MLLSLLHYAAERSLEINNYRVNEFSYEKPFFVGRVVPFSWRYTRTHRFQERLGHQRSMNRSRSGGSMIAFFLIAFSNNLLEREIWLEKRLLADLQTDILKPEALEYTIAQFGEQLKTTLGRLSGELAQMRERKRTVEVELRPLTETAALTGPSSFLIQAINEREQELRQITDKLLSTGPESIDSRLDEIRIRHQEALGH